MRFLVVTAPESPAVSLAEMKAHLRVDHVDDDDRILELVVAAQAGLESPDIATLGRPVAAQEIEMEAEGEWSPLRLFGPIDTEEPIDIVYRDASGADVSVDSTLYRIDRADTFAPRLVALGSWPFGPDVRIRCTAGLYEDDPRLGNFKTAIKLQVQMVYDGVEDAQPYQTTIENLLATYRVRNL